MATYAVFDKDWHLFCQHGRLMKEFRRNWYGGLTLIELLVVIGVVSVLFSILLVVIGKGKMRGQSVKCIANLREWGNATMLYSEKTGGLLPKDGAPNGRSRVEGWYVELPPLVGQRVYHELAWHTNASEPLDNSIWICPSNEKVSNGNNLFHYALNRGVNGSGVGNRQHLSSLTYPSMTVWMFDNGGRAAVAGVNNADPDIHDGGGNFLFLDGHVEKVPGEEYWDFTRDRGHTDSSDLLWNP